METKPQEKTRKALPARGVAVPGLVAAMQARDVSRLQLAQDTDLDPATIWRLMNGKTRAGREVLSLLCGSLKASEEELTHAPTAP
jgi:transcriptional regulator with XRE-family HTH domain